MMLMVKRWSGYIKKHKLHAKENTIHIEQLLDEVDMGSRRHSARKIKQRKNDEVIFSTVNKMVQDLLDRESIEKTSESYVHDNG